MCDASLARDRGARAPADPPTAARSPRLVQLDQAVAGARASLLDHPVYARLTDLAAVRTFMQVHVVAVWDFMALLKSLQRRLTTVEVLWTPPADRHAARLVNEIVLGEETDQLPEGGSASHLELYLDAMQAVGADTAPCQRLLESLRQTGERLDAPARLAAALDAAALPGEVRAFVEGTVQLALYGQDHEVAASFVLGREGIIPDMFGQMIEALDAGGAPGLGGLLYYLDRHVELDGEEHGPAAERLLAHLAGDDDQRWAEVEAAGREALEARHRLWDFVVAQLG